MFISLITYIVVVLHLQCALADTNGMDMSMDGAMSLASGSMLPYLHFTSGDNVLFLGWVPKSAGAMVGTCIGLFMLALVERWVAACRAVMEAHWSKRWIYSIQRIPYPWCIHDFIGLRCCSRTPWTRMRRQLLLRQSAHRLLSFLRMTFLEEFYILHRPRLAFFSCWLWCEWILFV